MNAFDTERRVVDDRTTLKVGTEIEYPEVTGEQFVTGGGYSGSTKSAVREDYGRRGWPNGTVDSDPTAGLELTTQDPVSPKRLAEWYRMSIAELSKYTPHEPTGRAHPSTNASSFGLHVHVSPLTRSEARDLYDISTQEWFKLFVTTSITGREPADYRPFRNRYCSMEFDSHNSAVTNVRGEHWEWRLVEPMTPANFDLVMEFLSILKSQGAEEAERFARGIVMEADDRLTSVRRAETIGIENEIGDIETRFDVSRTSTGEFFNYVNDDSHAPYIYSVRDTVADDEFYVMYTNSYSEADNPFTAPSSEHGEITYEFDSVLEADTLSPVSGSLASELREAVQEARNSSSGSGATKSRSTDVLIERLKHKKQKND